MTGFIEGEQGGVVGARRDASFYKKPGQAWRYHVATADGTAACRPGPGFHKPTIPLVDFTAMPAERIDKNLRCQRAGCKERWPT